MQERFHATGGGAAEFAIRRPSPWALLVWFAVWIGIMAFFYRPTGQAERPLVDLSQVATEVRAGDVQKITVQGDTLLVKRADGGEQHSHKEPLVSVTEALTNLGVEPEALHLGRNTLGIAHIQNGVTRAAERNALIGRGQKAARPVG